MCSLMYINSKEIEYNLHMTFVLELNNYIYLVPISLVNIKYKIWKLF
jgi:hypothetical protein